MRDLNCEIGAYTDGIDVVGEVEETMTMLEELDGVLWEEDEEDGLLAPGPDGKVLYRQYGV